MARLTILVVVCLCVSYVAALNSIQSPTIPQTRLTPTLELRGGYTTPRDVYSTYASISTNGSLVFSAFLGSPFTSDSSTVPEEAVLFQNNNGDLTRLHTLYVDTVANYTTGAAASRDFTRFFIVDHSWNYIYGVPVTTRLRLFDPTLNGGSPLATQFLAGGPLNGDVPAPIISFTDDNAYIIMAIDALTGHSNLHAPELLLLDGTTLDTLLTFDFQSVFSPTSTYSVSGAYFFTILDCTPACASVDYVAVGYQEIAIGGAVTNNLLMLHLIRSGPSLAVVNSALVPALPVDIRSLPYKVPRTSQSVQYMLLSVTSDRADISGEVTTVMTISQSPTTLPGNGNELAVWKFDYLTNMATVAADNIAQNAEGACLNPYDGGNSLLVVYSPQPTNPTNFSDPLTGRELIPRLLTGLNYPQIVNTDEAFALGSLAKSVQFDAQGRWVVVGSSKGPQDYSGPSSLFDGANGLWQNVLLYYTNYYQY